METKICSSCKILKPLGSYSYKNKSTQTLRARCRSCESKSYFLYKSKNKRKLNNDWRKASKKYYDSTPTINRTLRPYKLTMEGYNNILAAQKHKCAICNSENGLVIDHNHDNNLVRGLLCNYCNLMLGYAKDNTNTLTSAIKYLKNNAR